MLVAERHNKSRVLIAFFSFGLRIFIRQREYGVGGQHNQTNDRRSMLRGTVAAQAGSAEVNGVSRPGKKRMGGCVGDRQCWEDTVPPVPYPYYTDRIIRRIIRFTVLFMTGSFVS